MSTLVCMRLSVLPKPLVESKKGKCKNCKEPIWIASYQIQPGDEGKTTPELAATAICIQCLDDILAKEAKNE